MSFFISLLIERILNNLTVRLNYLILIQIMTMNVIYSGLKISDRRKVFLSKLRYEILREIGGSDEQNEAAVYSRTEDKDCA